MTVTRKGWQPPAIPWNQSSIDRSQQTTGEVAGKAILCTAGLYLAWKGIQWACRKCTGTEPPFLDVRQLLAELSKDFSMDLLTPGIRQVFLPAVVNHWLAPSEFSRTRVQVMIDRILSLQILDSRIAPWCAGLADIRSLLDVDVFRVCAFLQIGQGPNVRNIGARWISLYNQVLVSNVQGKKKECFDLQIKTLVGKSQKEGIDPKVVSLLQLYIQQVASQGYPEEVNSEQCKQMRQALAILLVADFPNYASLPLKTALVLASVRAIDDCENLLYLGDANISKLWGDVILDWVSYHTLQGDKTVMQQRLISHLDALKKELLSSSNPAFFRVSRALAIVENMLENPGFHMDILAMLKFLLEQRNPVVVSFMRDYEEILILVGYLEVLNVKNEFNSNRVIAQRKRDLNAKCEAVAKKAMGKLDADEARMMLFAIKQIQELAASDKGFGDMEYLLLTIGAVSSMRQSRLEEMEQAVSK
jgi:hypothetical protein